ncbi:hypothetical protein SMICM304S_00065 [Streptomyces microflavus]
MSSTETNRKATEARTARRGTPPAFPWEPPDTFSSARGASPRSASENTIRDDPYRLALSAESSATNTTMFMILYLAVHLGLDGPAEGVGDAPPS